MSAVAPPSIYKLWDDVSAAIPRAQLSGIVGDVAHSFGYHLARRDLPGDDYSVTLPADRLGSSANASALDVSLPPDLMLTVTGRLLAAAKAKDPRLHALREFCGTTNGTQTHPYDLSNGQDGPLDSWDSSHLWHVHLSFYREYADNYAALAPIAQVMAGTTTGELTMDAAAAAAIADVKKDIAALSTRLTALFQVDVDGDGKPDVTGTVQGADRYALGDVLASVRATQQMVATLPDRLASLQKAVDGIPSTLTKVQAAVAAIKPADVVVDTASIVSGVVEALAGKFPAAADVAQAVSAKIQTLAFKAQA